MLKELLKILSLDKAKAVDLRSALDALEAGIPALEGAVRECEQARTGLLLNANATDAAHDAADAALRLAVRDRDRALAARSELTRKIDLANEAERAAALEAKRSQIEREAQGTAKALGRFLTLQNEMVSILNRLSHAEEAVAALNAELAAAGRTDLLDPVETRAIPTPTGEAFDYHSVRNRTMLKEFDGVPGWRDAPPAFAMNFGPAAKVAGAR